MKLSKSKRSVLLDVRLFFPVERNSVKLFLSFTCFLVKVGGARYGKLLEFIVATQKKGNKWLFSWSSNIFCKWSEHQNRSFHTYGTDRLVLKHEPRSVTLVQVFDNQKSKTRNESVDKDFLYSDTSLLCSFCIARCLPLWETRGQAQSIRPERWWAIPAQGEARGNSGEGP